MTAPIMIEYRHVTTDIAGRRIIHLRYRGDTTAKVRLGVELSTIPKCREAEVWTSVGWKMLLTERHDPNEDLPRGEGIDFPFLSRVADVLFGDLRDGGYGVTLLAYGAPPWALEDDPNVAVTDPDLDDTGRFDR